MSATPIKGCVGLTTPTFNVSLVTLQMDDEETSGKGSDLSDSPLLAQLLVVKMEELTDKLKLLDYEKNFCKALKFKPFPRYIA